MLELVLKGGCTCEQTIVNTQPEVRFSYLTPRRSSSITSEGVHPFPLQIQTAFVSLLQESRDAVSDSVNLSR